jgi:competence protein ComEC
LSVGQGDAIAIRTPRDRWILIDAGPAGNGFDAGRDVVVPFLRRRGVRSLEAFFLSHGDMDHVGGAPAVLAALDVRRVIEPGQPLGQAGYRAFLAAVAAAGVPWTAGRPGDTLRMDGVELAVLHPSAAWLATELAANENSLIVHLRYRDFDLLLTGDAGLPAEAVLDDLGRYEVLKVGHHGSAGSTGPAFLARVAPRVAVIPVGRGNRYGHPAPDVLARLRAAGSVVARTDQDGTVTLTTDGQYFAVASGATPTFITRVLCAFSPSRPSSRSSSSRSGCTPTPAGSSPTSFTTWP